MASNPFFTATPPVLSESVRDHLRKIISTYLAAVPLTKTLVDAVLQALHPQLADPQVWAIIRQDLGL